MLQYPDLLITSKVKCNIRSQPPGPNPKVRGAQVSQHRPITLGLHSHRPPTLLQDWPTDPWMLHLQAGGTGLQNGRDGDKGFKTAKQRLLGSHWTHMVKEGGYVTIMCSMSLTLSGASMKYYAYDHSYGFYILKARHCFTLVVQVSSSDHHQSLRIK